MNIIFGVSRPLHMQPHIRLSEKLGKSQVASQEFHHVRMKSQFRLKIQVVNILNIIYLTNLPDT